MNGSPDLRINKTTGEMTVHPTQEGIYQVGVKVEEYRNGEKISEVLRDFQIWVFQKLVAGIEESGVTALRVFPNPFMDDLQIELELEQPQKITVEVLDVLGKRHYFHDFGQVSKGLVREKINLDAVGNQQLYFIKIRVGERMIVKRVQRL